jgi:phosphatidylglycerol:prolipoprotein diacylglycerol transferase
VHPVLFRIGGFAVYGYGVLYALGVAVGLLGARRLLRRDGVEDDTTWDLALALIAGVVLGARLEYVRSHLAEFAGAPWRVLALRDGGLVFYGGFVGAVVAVLAVARWRKVPPLRVFDAYAVFLPFGHALGRVGCVLAGCCWGAPTDLPWGLRYPAGHESGSVPTHPVPLYEAAFNVVLGVFLLRLHGRRRYEGQVLASFLLTYPVFRAFNETLRGDVVRGFVVGSVTNAQATSAVLVVVGLALVWFGQRSARPTGGAGARTTDGTP